MQAWFLLALVTVLLWGAWGFLSKIGSDGLGATSAAAWQGAGGLFVVLLLLAVTRFRVEHDARASVAAFAAGAALWLGLVAFAFALAMPGAQASLVVPVTALYPVVALALGVLVLGERLTVTQGAGVAAAVLAVVLLSS